MTREQTLRATNLNLLPALHAILKHRNLTRAASELNVTQSAASNSLRRLREIFGDALLVKAGREMRLTDKARALLGPLDETIQSIQTFLDDKPFDPATARRRFRIATADYVSAVLLPRLLEKLGSEAPHVGVQFLTARRRSTDDLKAETIDLVIGPKRLVGATLFEAGNQNRDLVHEPLFVDRFVCVAGPGTRIPRKMSAADYLRRPHASFFLDLDTHSSLEQVYLQDHAIAQFDRVLSANFSLLPMIAAKSDCLALIPESLARLMAPQYRLRVMDSPLPVPDLDLIMVWSRRRDREADLAWLRGALKRSIPDLRRASPASEDR
jgi:DNA-binding transcriptional LysR family regulator